MRPTHPIVTLLLAISGAALAEEPDNVVVTYGATVGARRILGVSRSIDWSATQLADDRAQVRLRVPIDSFDSGDRQLDSLLRSVLQFDRYPFIEVEGNMQGESFEGTLTVHGISQPLAVFVVTERSGTQLVTSTSFAIDLDRFGVSVPSVGNRVAVDFVARLSANPRAVIAGGAVSLNRDRTSSAGR